MHNPMAGEQQAAPAVKRRPGRPKGDDPRAELRKRLNKFLDNPTNPATLDSLVSGLVDYELRARLTAMNAGHSALGEAETTVEAEHAPT